VHRGYLIPVNGSVEVVSGSAPIPSTMVFKLRRDQEPTCLNTFCSASSPDNKSKTITMMAAVEDLRLLMSTLHARFISEHGVDYAGMRGSEEFRRFRLATVDLQAVDLGDLPQGEDSHSTVVAFYINLYNCLILSGEVAFGHPKWVLERKRFWRTTSFRVGPHVLSCEDIEHGILRCNRSGQFGSGDARLALVLTKFDYRIHFALNCGARSCPPIRVYTASNTQKALQFAFESFMLDNVRYDAGRNTLTVSKLLQWYKSDFIGDDNADDQECLLSFVRGALPRDHSVHQGDEKLLASMKIVFDKYDWSCNDAQ
jgi:hypothetical protein